MIKNPGTKRFSFWTRNAFAVVRADRPHGSGSLHISTQCLLKDTALPGGTRRGLSMLVLLGGIWTILEGIWWCVSSSRFWSSHSTRRCFVDGRAPRLTHAKVCRRLLSSLRVPCPFEYLITMLACGSHHVLLISPCSCRSVIHRYTMI